jgi:glycerol uptake facilitator-like aquaporin
MKRPTALAAEGIGSLLVAATVVGSGIMAERLNSDSVAVALLTNTGDTVAVLATLIGLLGPLSGAHFIPRCLSSRPDRLERVRHCFN